MLPGTRSHRSPARAMPPCSRPIASAIATAFRAGASLTKKRTRACSTACWPRPADATSLARPLNSSPARSITQFPETEVLRLLSFALLLAIWWTAALFVGAAKLPSPPAVLDVVIADASSGALFLHLGATLARVSLAFVLAMWLGSALGFGVPKSLGTAIGYLMGRVKLADRLGHPWLILLLNLPALVVIVLAYIWAGLTEAAAIAAIAINKLPTAIVTLREGARALDRSLDEMASVFAMRRLRAFRHVVLPQLAPYIAASARSGLSLVWKIVLVAELLGRPNGVGFEIGVAFQLFDTPRLLAYSLTFAAVVLVIETALVQPFEARATRWRPRAA